MGIFPKVFQVELGLRPRCERSHLEGSSQNSLVSEESGRSYCEMHVGLKIPFIGLALPPSLQPPSLYTFLKGHYSFAMDVETKRDSKLRSIVHVCVAMVPFAEWKLVPISTCLSP